MTELGDSKRSDTNAQNRMKKDSEHKETDNSVHSANAMIIDFNFQQN